MSIPTPPRQETARQGKAMVSSYSLVWFLVFGCLMIRTNATLFRDYSGLTNDCVIKVNDVMFRIVRHVRLAMGDSTPDLNEVSIRSSFGLTSGKCFDQGHFSDYLRAIRHDRLFIDQYLVFWLGWCGILCRGFTVWVVCRCVYRPGQLFWRLRGC